MSTEHFTKEEQSCVLVHQVCATCKTELNEDEIEYYGNTCNECEGRTMYEEGPERERLDTVTELRKQVASLTARCRQLEGDKAKLREFAQSMLSEWPDTNGMDGGDLQDIAEKCGLLEPHTVTGPCDPEGCNCAEYGEWPIECYRKTELLKGAKP